MKQRYWLCRRSNTYYVWDTETGRRQSLKTRDQEEAERLLHAKREAARNPLLNVSIAKAYLAAADPKLPERTWNEVMTEFCSKGRESTRIRRQRGLQRPPFKGIRHRKLIETHDEDLRQVLKMGGAAVNHFMRCLHNLALGLGWLPAPIIPAKLWPRPQVRVKRGITSDEHNRIMAAEANIERRHFYELLWETGASQSDGASLTADNIDWLQKVLSYRRKKTGQLCYLKIGKRLETLLRELPREGQLFPKINQLLDKDRAAEFRRRCRLLKIEGVSLHSYRYALAERAACSGYPERFAQQILGHASKAVHRAYAKAAMTVCPSLEDYEPKIVSA